MKSIKGPGIFLAQFMGDEAPFNNLDNICAWAASLGFKGVQIPTNDPRCIDLALAAESKTYCDDWRAILDRHGLVPTELATHLQGQLVAVHPAYDALFDGFAPEKYRNNPTARTEWAVEQMKFAARASQNLGLTAVPSFSGSFLWPFFHPWPQRPVGLVEEGFQELAKRWKPILDEFESCGVNVCYEVHPGEDIFDGETYEMFLDAADHHPRACLLYDPSHFVLQQLDYLQYIDHYHERIKAFHVKDAEFNSTGKQGTFGGYKGWLERAGRYRSPGDGQVDFKSVFSRLTQYGYDGWAVLEWECPLKHPEDGAKEGAAFINKNLIRVTEKAFDDFAKSGQGDEFNRSVLGIA